MIDRGERFELGRLAKPSLNGLFSAGADGLGDAIAGCIGPSLMEVEKQLHRATRSRCLAIETLSGKAAEMGGKRLRPMLVLLSAKAVETNRLRHSFSNDLMSIASAVELVHTASLVHDDVMDGAAERRHRPTIASQAGNSNAVLLGDFLFTRAYAVAANCRSGYAARKIAKAATELCEGELRQQATVGHWGLSMREYRQILEQKTGSLCSVSCRLGAWSMGGAAVYLRALTRFGRSLGLAFQIFDDWLDYWGTHVAGKTLGTDLGQGKPTLPLLRLLSTCDGIRRNRLHQLLEQGSIEAQEEVRYELDRSDASEFTMATARKLACRSIDAIAVLPATESRDCLMRLAEFSVGRAA